MPLKVYAVCSGLGRINRGYESFTRECFDALKHSDELDLRLFKGAGKADVRERAIFTLPRKSLAAAILGTAIRRTADSRRYFGEAYSFGTSLLPHLLEDRPNVVFFSDWPVGELLRSWRKMFNLSFKLLLRNGGPCPPDTLKLPSRNGAVTPRFDHINQISPEHFEQALAAGLPAAAQTLLPSGFNISRAFEPPTFDAKNDLRRRFGLPTGRPLVVSVGAVALDGPKRFEYLIEELARLPEPRPFLVILGEREKGADEIERRATLRLGTTGFTMRTEPRDVVDDYYQAADLFVLASLREGFGRVYVEALSHGLTCVAHDYVTSRFVLGVHGSFGNLEKSGALAELIRRGLDAPDSPELRIERHRAAHERFSWEVLTPHYIEMFRRVNAGDWREPAA